MRSFPTRTACVRIFISSPRKAKMKVEMCSCCLFNVVNYTELWLCMQWPIYHCVPPDKIREKNVTKSERQNALPQVKRTNDRKEKDSNASDNNILISIKIMRFANFIHLHGNLPPSGGHKQEYLNKSFTAKKNHLNEFCVQMQCDSVDFSALFFVSIGRTENGESLHAFCIVCEDSDKFIICLAPSFLLNIECARDNRRQNEYKCIEKKQKQSWWGEGGYWMFTNNF